VSPSLGKGRQELSQFLGRQDLAFFLMWKRYAHDIFLQEIKEILPASSLSLDFYLSSL
jgi:hypothetical protein